MAAAPLSLPDSYDRVARALHRHALSALGVGVLALLAVLSPGWMGETPGVTPDGVRPLALKLILIGAAAAQIVLFYGVMLPAARPLWRLTLGAPEGAAPPSMVCAGPDCAAHGLKDMLFAHLWTAGAVMATAALFIGMYAAPWRAGFGDVSLLWTAGLAVLFMATAGAFLILVLMPMIMARQKIAEGARS